MKIYLVYMGENFESAVARHGDNYFLSAQEAVDYGKMNLEPGQRFWVCDENGGVLVISQAPRIVGRA